MKDREGRMNYTSLSNAPKALTFDDVQIVPKYSEVASRSHCDTTTEFTQNYKLEIPLVASPMASVCGVDMAKTMWELGGVGIIHRFNTVDEQVEMVKDVKSYIREESRGLKITLKVRKPVIAAAVGAKEADIYRAEGLLSAGVNVILIDVAHGEHRSVRDTLDEIQRLRRRYEFDIIAGNIATQEAAETLESWGADALRVGIGGGCFTPNMQVRTTDGLKPIKDVQIGDMVYTHTGNIKSVIDKLTFDRDEEIYEINGIECTHNHEFYVVHQKYESVVTDENYHDYAEWISAENLTDEYFLVEV